MDYDINARAKITELEPKRKRRGWVATVEYFAKGDKL